MAASKQFPHPFGKLAENYRKMRRGLPLKVSVIAVEEFKTNFRRGGYRSDSGGVQFWQKRKNDKKGKGRGILVKSGRLPRSIRPAPTYDHARAVSDVPYAQAHNEGLSKTVSVRSHRRSRHVTRKEGTGVYSVKTKRERRRSVKEKKGSGKVKSHKRKMNLPARPFMITTRPLLNNIEKQIFKDLDALFKNS